MVCNIDRNDGSILLGERRVLARNEQLSQVLGMGLTVWNDLEVNTGWRHISIKDIFMLGRPAAARLSFFREELKKVSFMLLDRNRAEPDQVRRHYDEILMAEFGNPQERHPHGMTAYILPWGRIETAYDLHNNQWSILLIWI
ncbi:hypothetical protein QA646_30195 (plasmid) [Rhizobium sp. CB3090]|uniref:hypothetical protein n=1 Tax=Rhizobium sp. CB3090 TaxID=3039156 RepID=UPI0024B20E51|nr:hypothetical protein [Rhizobium sp. CB3090]WFU13265.1 hypothetical protein QA646_30195 [Rhizobium sp. CB3090]